MQGRMAAMAILGAAPGRLRVGARARPCKSGAGSFAAPPPRRASSAHAATAGWQRRPGAGGGRRALRGREGVLVAHAAGDGMNDPSAGVWAELGAEGEGRTPPPISKDDDAFAEEGLAFVWGHDEEAPVEDLNNLFVQVGFPEREADKVKVALSHTYKVLWVKSLRKSRWAKEGQMIAFARATGDRVFNATIWDVAVLPSWQGVGLGRGLMERMAAELVREGIPNINLYAEPTVVDMYKKLSFDPSPGGVRGMAFDKSRAHNMALLAGKQSGR